MERVMKGNEIEARQILDAVESLLDKTNTLNALKKIEVNSTREGDKKYIYEDDIEARIAFTSCLNFQQCGSATPLIVEFKIDWWRDGHSTTYAQSIVDDSNIGYAIYPGTTIIAWAEAIVRAMHGVAKANREFYLRRAVEFAQLEGSLSRYAQ